MRARSASQLEAMDYRTVLLLACAPLLGEQYTISTVAGYGAAGVFFTNPTSVAVNSAGDVYVADWSGVIRKIWIGEGTTTIAAGTGILGYSGDGELATSAMIGKAIGIGLDHDGNLWIADGDNNRIRRIDAGTGVITTVAGPGIGGSNGGVNAGLSRPTGVTVNAEGDLYFSNFMDAGA